MDTYVSFHQRYCRSFNIRKIRLCPQRNKQRRVRGRCILLAEWQRHILETLSCDCAEGVPIIMKETDVTHVADIVTTMFPLAPDLHTMI